MKTIKYYPKCRYYNCKQHTECNGEAEWCELFNDPNFLGTKAKKGNYCKRCKRRLSKNSSKSMSKRRSKGLKYSGLCKHCLALANSRSGANPYRIRDGLRLLFEGKLNKNSRLVRGRIIELQGGGTKWGKHPKHVNFFVSDKHYRFLASLDNASLWFREQVEKAIKSVEAKMS